MKVAKALKVFLALSIISLGGTTALFSQDVNSSPKKVLAIFIFKQGMPWAYHLEESMRTALSKKFGSALEFNVEYADQSRFPEKAYRAKAIDLYRYKYSKKKMDIVLVLGAESVDLMIEYGSLLFDDTPVILINTDKQGLLKPNMTSMTWGIDFAKTGALIHDLLPKTKHLFVISGVSMMDQNLKKLAIKALAGFENHYVIHYIDGYTKQDLLLKVASLPEDSAIFFISLFRDVSGQSFVPRDVIIEVSEQANAPTFAMVDTYLGYGIVGGNLLSASYQGKKYAEMVIKILAGESLANLDYIDKGNQAMFDWRQLKRWSIDENRLPINSIVRYRELSIWEEHQWKIVGVIIIILMQALAMAGLLVQHKRRRKAEEEAQKLRDERAHISRVLAMGEIAASLAHEINQPLSAIRSYAQAAQRFLENDPAEPAEAHKALVGIVAGNRRAEEVIKRIRMSLKKEPFKHSSIKAKELVAEVIALAASKAQEQGVSLKSEVTLDLPLIFGDRIQLQQVLFNLVLNAIEATTGKNGSYAEVVILALQTNTSFITLSIRDTGTGIDEQKADSLFDAFYTTKAEGLGIGLSISRSIIEDHGGRLWAKNNDDMGSTFSFSIPVCEDDKK